jgi:hypothetical protein
MPALLHRQMVCGRMERRHAKTKTVAHREREDGTKMDHEIDAGSPALATTTTMTARLPRSFKFS